MALKRGDTETNFEIRSRDSAIPLEEFRRLPRTPLYFILDNLRSAFNVGSIFRTSDILRIQGLFLCGYTAAPPHVKLQKTSLGTIDYVPWRSYAHAIDAVRCLKDRGIAVWAAETTSASVPYTAAEYPPRLGIVFGNEALGIARDVLEACDRIIEVPVHGFKNSLNVASACAVIGFWALYRIQETRSEPTEGDPAQEAPQAG